MFLLDNFNVIYIGEPITHFWPVLVIALGAAGLSAFTGYLDYVLLPALALCIGLIGYGLYGRRNAAACCKANAADKPTTKA